MKQFKAEAIVLAVKDWRGADKVVTLFTNEFGKITALAYGLRQPKSRLSGSIQLFSHIDAAFDSGKGLAVLRQAGVLQSNRPLREDLDRMAYAALVVEVAAELFGEHEQQPEVFTTLCQAMKLLTERNPRIAAIAVCWQLLAFAGYQPEFEQCVVCGDAQESFTAFDPEAGGSCCPACRQGQQIAVSSAACLLLKRLLSLNLAEPAPFTAVVSAITETEKLLLHFLLHRLDKKLNSIAFIQSLAGLAKNAGNGE